VRKAIQCGEKLAEKKAALDHGEWLPWVEKHLTFNMNTAGTYMRLSANSQHVVNSRSIREAVKLLAEPKEETPTEPATEPEYNNDPELQKRATDAVVEAANLKKALKDLDFDLKVARSRLEDLEKLEADRVKIETALKNIHELKKKKQELFADSESLRVATQVLVRSREFFTRECMQVAALKFRPGTVEAIRQDMAGLIELVDNWLAAMKEKFS